MQPFYRAQGFRKFKLQPHYYEDDVAAVRMEKSLAPPPDPSLMRVLLRADIGLHLRAGGRLDGDAGARPRHPLDQTTEIRLWRRSTTVFMTSGLGGCSPEGLALARSAAVSPSSCSSAIAASCSSIPCAAR